MPPPQSIGMLISKSPRRVVPTGAAQEISNPHQLVDVVADQHHHVPRQQADQPGQGLAQERRRMHQPDGPSTAEAGSRTNSSKMKVSGPAAQATKLSRPNRPPPPGPQGLGIAGLDHVIAAAEGWETPQRSGQVIEQPVTRAYVQGGPDNGVGYPGIPQNLLYPPFASKV